MDNEYNYDNEIIEIGVDKEPTEPVVSFPDEEEKASKAKKKKKENKIKKIITKIKDKWNRLSKKGKIITVIVGVLILLLIIGLIVFLVFFNKEDDEIKEVIIEEENYRYENGYLILLGEEGKELGKYECVVKDAKKCYVAYLSNDEDTFDRTIYETADNKEYQKRSKIYMDKYVYIYDDETVFLYNIKDSKKEAKVSSIKAYDTKRDLVVVKDNDNKYGIVEFTDGIYESVINNYYDYLGIINTKDLLVLSKTDNKERIISIDNKNLSKEFNENIKSASKDFIAAGSGTYNLYTYDYEEVKSDYDYINFYDDYIGAVKDNKLYFFDKELNKLNEEGYKLNSKNYNGTYKLNKKNKVDELEKAYEIVINPGTIGIEVDEETYLINVYEGVVSSNYNYVNYFDSKLYFYSDVEKNDLIGVYNCTNKNKITSGNDTLKNCSVLGLKDGATGIYNNNFVFINDNSDVTNSKNIILYSIKEKKNKANYTELNVISKNELASNIGSYYTGESFFIAKSASKNKYGVIKLESAKATNVVSFNYNEIKPTGSRYLLTNSDNKQSICDSKFNKLSDDLDYIDMIDNTYYVGINNKKLNLYRYDTTTTKILESDIDVPSNDNKSYKLTIGGMITVIVGNNTYKYDLTGKVVSDDGTVPASDQTPNDGE